MSFPNVFPRCDPRDMAARPNKLDGLTFHVNTANKAWEQPTPPVCHHSVIRVLLARRPSSPQPEASTGTPVAGNN